MKSNVIQLYLRIAAGLVDEYIVEAKKKFVPLHLYLKSYFKKNTKLGKRDRNAVSELVYSFFRLGHTAESLSIEDKIILGSFLCNTGEGVRSFLVREKIGNGLLPGSDRIRQAQNLFSAFKPENIFAFDVDFSEGVTKEKYLNALLQKPSTFIRVVEGHRDEVEQELRFSEIDFETVAVSENALIIDSNKNLMDLQSWKKGYFEVQDLSSQQTAQLFNPQKGQYWWDACAASGGKSLSLLSKQKEIKILATDIRKNILENYIERVKRTGFKNFETAVVNAGEQIALKEKFDGIICDVPCSGSGTWHRTPENIYFFNKEQLDHYASLQKNILQNAEQYLKPGGELVYITCSVFNAENEEIISLSALEKLSSGIINNFELRADCMFAARFKNS